MLVTFKTSAYSDITMFGTPAVALLKLMGMSGNVPGAIMAEDVPAALDTLKQALADLADSQEPSASDAIEDEKEQEESSLIGLDKRAGPLVSLLEAAATAKENVMWNN